MKTNTTTLLLSALITLCCMCSCHLDSSKTTGTADTEDYRDSEKWGKVIEDTFTISDFTAVQLMNNANVKLYQSDTLRIEVVGNEKAIENNEIAVQHNTLTICKKEGTPDDTPTITVRIYAPAISAIDIYGEGDCTFRTNATLDSDFAVNIYGSGDIDFEQLTCSDFTANIKGTGDIYAESITCSYATITVDGDGDINSDFKAKDITVTLNDAGKAKLNVDCTNLTVSANGTGDVKVKGQCESFIKSEKGLSSVNSRDLTMNKTIIK